MYVLCCLFIFALRDALACHWLYFTSDTSGSGSARLIGYSTWPCKSRNGNFGVSSVTPAGHEDTAGHVSSKGKVGSRLSASRLPRRAERATLGRAGSAVCVNGSPRVVTPPHTHITKGLHARGPVPFTFLSPGPA